MKKFTTLKMFKFTKKNIFKNYAFIWCIVFFSLQNNASADNSKFITKYSSELEKIENFLNKITNLSAKFIQNSNGEVVEGKFYLARNPNSAGKMRIEYLAEPKILIIVNGAILSYHDIDLDEISRLSTNTTPASFLTRPNIAFNSKDVEITNVEKTSEYIKVSVMKKNRKDAGEFSLIFNNQPFEFVKMQVKNDLDQIINVELKNIDFQSKISDKLFIIKNSDNE